MLPPDKENQSVFGFIINSFIKKPYDESMYEKYSSQTIEAMFYEINYSAANSKFETIKEAYSLLSKVHEGIYKIISNRKSFNHFDFNQVSN